MINDLRIHLAIIMYMFGCFSIMIFNAIIIYRKKYDDRAMERNTKKWAKAINQQLNTKSGIAVINLKHKKHLLKRLLHAEKLIAFSNALTFIKQEHDDLYSKYLGMLAQSKVFHTLAPAYIQKKSEERAYFAYFVSQHPAIAKNLTDIMNEFIVSSDIYCRANVLKALCKIGDMHGVESVLQFFSDKPIFIHHLLLAEDLFDFAGDKDALALSLWGNYKFWNDNIVLGIITFITMFSGRFKEAFLPVLQNRFTNGEIRLAIIRYYKDYSFKPAHPILIECLNQTDNYDIAIQAASALCAYPGPATTAALTSALESENWHVRYNAAAALVELGEHMGILNNSDTEVSEIILYILAQNKTEKAISMEMPI
ncbi:MAG: HEAT repeat domain-containing protein [Defluviitaleaceae bacterium]|nr:HEAT repeat domain-containing protein [Defluviitaleaceae bacterium]